MKYCPQLFFGQKKHIYYILNFPKNEWKNKEKYH